MEPSSPFSPRSPLASSISDLFILSLAIAAVIFAVVAGLVLYSAFRFRERSGQPLPRQISGHRTLELVWTAIPALLLVVLFYLTITTMRAADPPVGNQQPDLIVTGYQWWWDVRYPKTGVVTANEIHIPVGRPLLVQLESGDVIHDFWVPQLGPKRDMTPGHPTHVWIQADAPGVYLGACAEYCGNQHAWMRLRVIAQPQAEFDAWQQQQSQPAPPPADGDAARGAQVFLERTCVNCHAIAGTPATARAGPDLSHLGSRQTLAAGVIENTPENLRRWLEDPQAIKPGNHMPSLRLTDDELRALVAYMTALK